MDERPADGSSRSPAEPVIAQLRGTDAFHVLQDSAAQPMHTLKIAILDVGGRAEPLTVDAVRAWAAAMVDEIPAMRWQLRRMPLGLARPFWAEAADLDLAHHVQGRRVDGASGLDVLLADLCGERMAQDRPLWRLWVVDGVAPDRVVFVLQLHHALADGGASVQLWEALAAGEVSGPGRTPGPAVRRQDVLRAGLASQVRQVRKIPGQWRRFRTYLASSRAARGDDVVTQAFVGPMTRFNHRAEGERACAFATLPFADLRACAAALGGTVNDLYLVLCGGAVRRYLALHGELPAEGLTTICPAGVERDPGSYGNAVTTWYVALHTEIADPRERLAAIQRSVGATRRATERDPHLLPDWQDYALANHAIVWIMRAVERTRRRPAFNAIVSNVRGPAPIELMGSPVVALRSLGPVSGRMGLNITGWTYGEDFTIGLQANRAWVPDIARLAACFDEELADLRSLSPVRPSA